MTARKSLVKLCLVELGIVVAAPAALPAAQTSTLGTSGHYDDVSVKQNGAWLIKQRTI